MRNYLFLLVFLAACQKNVITEPSGVSNETITLRGDEGELNIIPIEPFTTCEPGNMVIEDNIMYFPTMRDYFQTEHFLNCADEETKADWRSSYDLVTVEKAYRNFMRSTCEAEFTEEQFKALLAEYNGKVRVVELEDGSYDIDELYSPNGAFLNLEGVFGLAGSLRAERENFSVVVEDGDKAKLEKALADQQSDPENGVTVTPRNWDFFCCEHVNYGELHKGERKLTNYYKWKDSSPYHSGKQVPGFEFTTKVANFKRNWLNRWVCDKRVYHLDLEIAWVHKPYGNGTRRDTVRTQWSTHNECEYKTTRTVRAPYWVEVAKEIENMACVNGVIQTVVTDNPDRSLTIKCKLPE